MREAIKHIIAFGEILGGSYMIYVAQKQTDLHLMISAAIIGVSMFIAAWMVTRID